MTGGSTLAATRFVPTAPEGLAEDSDFFSDTLSCTHARRHARASDSRSVQKVLQASGKGMPNLRRS